MVVLWGIHYNMYTQMYILYGCPRSINIKDKAMLLILFHFNLQQKMNSSETFVYRYIRGHSQMDFRMANVTTTTWLLVGSGADVFLYHLINIVISWTDIRISHLIIFETFILVKLLKFLDTGDNIHCSRIQIL